MFAIVRFIPRLTSRDARLLNCHEAEAAYEILKIEYGLPTNSADSISYIFKIRCFSLDYSTKELRILAVSRFHFSAQLCCADGTTERETSEVSIQGDSR